MQHHTTTKIIFLTFLAIICLHNNSFSVAKSKSVKKNLLKIYFIELDRGECILIDIFGRKKILIDTGPKTPISSLIPKKKKRKRKKKKKKEKGIFPIIRKLKIKKLDFVIISYPHKNYIGNLPAILTHIKTKNILDAAYALNSEAYKKSLKIIEKKNIKYTIARKNYVLNIDNVMFEILNPQNKLPYKYTPYEKSIVIKMSYKNYNFLFTSAIGNKTIANLLENYPKFKNCFLKLPYNYKGKKNIIEFIKKISPKAVYIPKKIHSYGIVNYLCHNKIPSYSALEKGNVTIKTDGKEYFAVK